MKLPYSLYSEKALSIVTNSIGSEEIRNGSIKLEDLEPNILSFAQLTGQISESQIPNTIARVTALNAHINSRTAAHAGSAISVEGPFTFSAARNLEQVLKDIDTNLLGEISNRSGNRDTLTSSIAGEASARSAADTTLTTNLNTTNTNLTSHTTATTVHGSDGVVVGLNTLNSSLATHAAQTTNVHGLTPAAGNLVGTDAAQTLTNKILTSPSITNPSITGTVSGGATYTNPVINGGNITGNITANSGVLIDGVDVGTLQGLISTAQSTANTGVSNAAAAQSTANGALTAAGTAQTTVNGAATAAATAQSTADSKVTKTGDTMTGPRDTPLANKKHPAMVRIEMVQTRIS